MPLYREIGTSGLAYVAPQAAGNTWYPYSFLMPIEQNEPFLSSALATVGRALDMVSGAGIPAERIILAGLFPGNTWPPSSSRGTPGDMAVLSYFLEASLARMAHPGTIRLARRNPGIPRL